MKSNYNYDEGVNEYVCPVCGYKYVEETRYNGKILEGDEEFIEMEDFKFHSTDNSDYYPRTRHHTIYACPKCGVLQLDI